MQLRYKLLFLILDPFVFDTLHTDCLYDNVNTFIHDHFDQHGDIVLYHLLLFNSPVIYPWWFSMNGSW